MSRQTMTVIALASLTLAAAPFATANAQSGDAIASAEHACRIHGVDPDTAAFQTCVERATMAYEDGQPEVASSEAAMVRGANDLCSSYGLTPATLGYRQCVGNEIEKRSIAAHNIAYAAPDEDQQDGSPHVSISTDSWGFKFDANGNLLDQDGYVIRAVP